MIWKPIREIRSRTGGLHFRRWRILETRWFNIYLHHIAKSDADKDPHSHPWSFLTLILCGGYVQFIRGSFGINYYIPCRPGTLHDLKMDEYHKIRLVKPTWTLVFTGQRHNEDWGYWTKSGFVQHEQYRKEKNGRV